MNNEAIARKLRELRGERSQMEIAAALNITQSALAMYESGKRIPRDEVKIRIAAFYGVSVESIFFAAEA